MAKLTIYGDTPLSKISREIYGHFSEHLGRCIYGGLYVGEDSPIPNVNGMRTDVVEALKQIRVPVLRWPGGCFADEYHWKDGIGPKESRKKMINTHWGGVVEDNSFGTHEFFELCRQLGCDAYVNGNMGSGTVQEMSEWVEYITFDGVSPMAKLRAENGHEKPWKLKFFGVGNENWGCGGNMLPEYYANEYRRYQTYVRNYDWKNPVRKICCGPNADDYDWTEKVLATCYSRSDPNFREFSGFMDGLSLHYYTVPFDWNHKGSATDFDEETYYRTIFNASYMKTLIEGHKKIMDKYDPQKKIALVVDEWGVWYDVEPGTNPGFLYQQNTMRDAMVASMTLNIFNKNSDRVRMANIAQMVNVLQSVILTEGDRMVKTPTYHVFDLYKYHQDGTLLKSTLETEQVGIGQWQIPNLTESVSVDEAGVMHITIANLSAKDAYDVDTQILGRTVKKVTGQILNCPMTAKNTFDAPEVVAIEDFADFTVTEDGLRFSIPGCSVLHLAVE